MWRCHRHNDYEFFLKILIPLSPKVKIELNETINCFINQTWPSNLKIDSKGQNDLANLNKKNICVEKTLSHLKKKLFRFINLN